MLRCTATSAVPQVCCRTWCGAPRSAGVQLDFGHQVRCSKNVLQLLAAQLKSARCNACMRQCSGCNSRDLNGNATRLGNVGFGASLIFEVSELQGVPHHNRIQNVHASPCSAVSACAQGSAGRRSYTLLAGLRYVWSCVAKAQWSYHSKLSPNFVVALFP